MTLTVTWNNIDVYRGNVISEECLAPLDNVFKAIFTQSADAHIEPLIVTLSDSQNKEEDIELVFGAAHKDMGIELLVPEVAQYIDFNTKTPC